MEAISVQSPVFSALPESVRITDITARDGFQNIKDIIPTETKTAVIDLLVDAGITKLEAVSFVSPKAVPQMADAARVIKHIRTVHPHVVPVALIPNLRGAADAVNAGIREISYVISASAAHNKANINRAREESLADLAAITRKFPDLKVNLSMSVVFGCPFEGEVPVPSVLWLLDESLRRGVSSVTLCDTIGVANPLQVAAVVDAVRGEHPNVDLALHLHDTHGMGLANTLAALRAGIDCFETAAGGLGGCPFAPGAAGNTSTEDMVNMLHRMGITTGVDLRKYLAAANLIRRKITPVLPGHLASAETYGEFCFFRPQHAEP
jgi:hydroxymethylglutaryl-CoA lyase